MTYPARFGDEPPPEPFFRPNPVAELVITNTGGKVALKLRVPSQPAQFTLLHGARPVRTGVRFVQHFPFLGLLPQPVDGWSDITELFIARYGIPKFGQAIWIRTLGDTGETLARYRRERAQPVGAQQQSGREFQAQQVTPGATLTSYACRQTG